MYVQSIYFSSKQKGVSFIQYDIEAYYPSIKETLLDKAVDFARGFHDITEDEKVMIKNLQTIHPVWYRQSTLDQED